MVGLTGKRAGQGAWRGIALAVLLLAPAAGTAAEPNPFLPPAERADDMEARLQKRVDKAVADAEERLVKAVVDALNGKDGDAMPKPVQDAVARKRAAGPVPVSTGGSSTNTSLPPGLPGLPPLPAVASAGGAAEVVPAGAVFIGCLDGKAFFQDRAGSPFLVDPRAFPSSSGGPGACGR
ncbi:hypothetical protein [Azospirillum sp. sgz302134]